MATLSGISRHWKLNTDSHQVGLSITVPGSVRKLFEKIENQRKPERKSKRQQRKGAFLGLPRTTLLVLRPGASSPIIQDELHLLLLLLPWAFLPLGESRPPTLRKVKTAGVARSSWKRYLTVGAHGNFHSHAFPTSVSKKNAARRKLPWCRYSPMRSCGSIDTATTFWQP